MSQIRAFRMTALAEGSSFLLLLFVAMPMKYVMGMPRVVTVVGANEAPRSKLRGIIELSF